MQRIIKISPNLSALSLEVASDFSDMVNKAAVSKKYLNIALSGGNTPRAFFSCLSNQFSENTRWEVVHFYWSDERCVPPADRESNYGMARDLFLSKVKIPAVNIHRIRGENDPSAEASRYSELIRKKVPFKLGYPSFNIVFLGLGADGHAASLFPGDNKVLNSKKICEVSTHPATGQKRITLTLPVINNAERVIFLVSGKDKAEIVAGILGNSGNKNYPAGMINPYSGKIFWYLDMDAASLLSQYA